MVPAPLIWLVGAGALAWLFSQKDNAPSPVPSSEGTPQPSPPSGGNWVLPAEGAPYADQIDAAAVANDVPSRLLGRLLYEESGFRPDVISGDVLGPTGDVGIAQFQQATADELGIEPTDPDQAIGGAARYLGQLHRQFGAWRLAVAAYNYGPGNVSRMQGHFDSLPAVVRGYANRIVDDSMGSATA
jgi:soluble lytic murein transglycosylase-like protein